jgi:hypothetical protein
MAEPLRYQTAMEILDPQEIETIKGLVETISKIQTVVARDTGHAHRGVHAKAQGVLVGELKVLPGLPPVLAQGLFATPAAYPAALRLSSIPGDLLDDSVSTPRGAALKVVGVPGQRVAGSEGDVTQDFLFASGKAFNSSNPQGFLRNLKLLAATTDKAPGLKKILSSVLRGVEKAVESTGKQSATLLTLGGYPEVHILGDEFYTQAPLLYGDYMAKLALKPSSANLRALSQKALDLRGHPDGIRQAVIEFFATQPAVWDLQAQLCTHLDDMPIEDPSVPWPEDQSPYVTVAQLHMPAQSAWSAENVERINEAMSFSPWHALAAHRPLGGIMRVRKEVYEAAVRLRAAHNQRTIVEPRSAAELTTAI